MKDAEIKKKLRKVFAADKYMALVNSEAIAALLLAEKLISIKDYKMMKNEVIDIMADKWMEKAKNEPELLRKIETLDSLQSLSNVNPGEL